MKDYFSSESDSDSSNGESDHEVSTNVSEIPAMASLDDFFENRMNVDDVNCTVTTVDDGIIAMPEHQRCCSHTLNLVATTDAAKALEGVNAKAYKKIHREVMGKCDAVWNLTSRSTKAADAAYDIIKFRFARPCATRWNSHYDAISLVLRAGDKLNAVCTALSLPQFQQAHMNFMRE